MSLRTLDFDRLELGNAVGDFKLSVVSSADFDLPAQTLAFTGETSLTEALAKMMWISRESSCRLDIRFSYNGHDFSQASWSQAIETLGICIRDSSLWKQLSLSACLELSQPSQDKTLQQHISIHIRPQDTDLSEHTLQTWPRSQRSYGLHAPASVPSAYFQRLRINFDFSTSSTTVTPGSKRLKIKPVNQKLAKTTSVSIDNQGERLLGNKSRDGYQCAAEMTEDILLSTYLDFSYSSHHNSQMEALLLEPIYMDFPFEIAAFQPTADQMQLFTDSHSELEQVCTEASPGDELLTFQEDAPPLYEVDDEDDMLLSQTTTQPTSPCSTATITALYATTNSTKSTSSTYHSLKRLLPATTECTKHAPSLTSPLALQLCSLAIQLLVAGRHTGSLRGTPEIALRSQLPTSITSLSSLVPSIFSPGYYQAMQTNARFLPSISHGVALSWPKNVQSPSLRRKLKELANTRTMTSNEADEEDVSEGQVGKTLSDVVQARLWGMMQRRLYDASAARKLRANISPAAGSNARNGVEVESFDDLLGGENGVIEVLDHSEDMLGNMNEDMIHDDSDMDDFEDLFTNTAPPFNNDDDDDDDEEEEGILRYFEQSAQDLEQRDVERETDEMLFGFGNDDAEEAMGEEILLLGGDDEKDDDYDDPSLLS